MKTSESPGGSKERLINLEDARRRNDEATTDGADVDGRCDEFPIRESNNFLDQFGRFDERCVGKLLTTACIAEGRAMVLDDSFSVDYRAGKRFCQRRSFAKSDPELFEFITFDDVVWNGVLGEEIH